MEIWGATLKLPTRVLRVVYIYPTICGKDHPIISGKNDPTIDKCATRLS